MLTEAQVKRYVKAHLDWKGYREVDSRERHETGPDLVMGDRRNGRTITIEAKGDSAGRSGMENKIVTALGQLVTRVKGHPNALLGLAVPGRWERRLLGKLGLPAMRALRVVVYLVHEDGRVVEVTRRTYSRRRAGLLLKVA